MALLTTVAIVATYTEAAAFSIVFPPPIGS